MVDVRQELSELQLHTLREVAALGFQNASSAIAQMTNAEVVITAPDVKIVEITGVPELLGGSEKEIAGLYLKMLGDISGNIMLEFQLESARKLAEVLLGEEEPDCSNISEMGISALKETGNIIVNTYLNVLAEVMDITTFPSVPHYAHDMLGAVMDLLLIEVSKASDCALVTMTNFSISDLEVEGNFLILPRRDSIELLFNKMKI